jgi:hypothetical protein
LCSEITHSKAYINQAVEDEQPEVRMRGDVLTDECDLVIGKGGGEEDAHRQRGRRGGHDERTRREGGGKTTGTYDELIQGATGIRREDTPA